MSTSEFKKISDEDKVTAFKSLLKGSFLSRHFLHIYKFNKRMTAYQTEIDSLTKRSKASENAFLSIYKVLAEAPDPYPLLEAAVVRP